ncbi:uncharacterized protein MELLADRAFT_40818 [Melampsora larici-populina 98AG31]|uniref:Uncharacterized protein n=1 Tax=Melampsora larici-populina (strain 98AG31 / pathotype 3-4-7) TaxID=747676 RepID=F4S9Y0_MELLP|nr:uncharacterized protein MELLADRAFT_40818 [Melampsora larici-populina 98AG31]EGF98551.1 hypothetical protein MELLADRAFT_40818 [Melampsora larici-populina 98AG31]
MDPLLEEDETDQTGSTIQRAVNPLDSRQIEAIPRPEKLPPPLPSLKAGDETVSGRDEPLVDEIACALREWYTLLFVHLNKRQYRLFHIMKEHIEALHMGRRQLLAQTLSTEEAAKLRHDLVNRLVYGNLVQDLDIIVRHPDYGALVDTEVDFEAVDSRSWMSAIRMYVWQVKLAYLSQTLSLDRGFVNGPLNLPDPLANNAISSMSNNNQSKLSTRPKFYHVMIDVKSVSVGPCAVGETMELYFSLYNKSESRFLTEEFCVILNHLGLPIRTKSKHSPNIAGGADDISIKLTASNLISVRTMFKDLSQHDVQDSIFLVCRIVKNGGMKSTTNNQPPLSASGSIPDGASSNILSPGVYEGDSASATASFEEAMSPTYEGAHSPQYALPDSNGEYSGMTFYQPRLGTQSIRRPFGCAVVEISSYTSHSNQASGSSGPSLPKITSGGTLGSGIMESPVSYYHMNIFSPVNEASFPTLHEDIIASRVKEFFGTGHFSSKNQGSYLSGSKNESIAIELRTFYGDTTSIIKENGARLSDIPLTSRLGFPDVVFPDDSRNEIYVKLWSGDFSYFHPGSSKIITATASGKNIEVAAELRTKTGLVLERVISRGSGEPKVTRYNSMVYKNNQTPTWGELMKLDISSDVIEDCHLFFTFRNRQDKNNRNHTTGNIDKPFAFAFLPLFSTNQTFIPDGEHNLALFKYDRQSATPEVYCRVNSSLEAGQTAPDITPALSKLLIPLRDAFVVRSFLCSTQHTQNEVLLKLIKWERLLDQPQSLQETLTKLKFASEVEICKFLRNIFDALFGVLVSRVNAETKEYNDLVFNALVTLLGIVSDRRFTNFKPVVDLYIDQHFACTTASTHLIRSLQSLLSNPTSPQNAQPLRSSIKVWGYLLRFIIRSRELQRGKDLTSGGLTSDVIETKFKHEITSVLNQITALMSLNSSTVIGTQTLAVQHFAALLPELGKVCGPHELLEKANSFVESISATKGKIVIWKLLLQEHIIMSHIFDLPDCRVQLIPKLTAWVKPHLGEFEEYTMIKAKDTDSTKDSARVSWLEGIRISTSLIAVALDKLHEALIDPHTNQDRTALAQEEDNVEYLLMLLPKLLDSFTELENPANIEAVQRLGTTASVISPVPIVFPASYPFSLLSSLPTKPTFGSNHPNQSQSVPSTQNGLGEIAAVMVTMILLSPDRLLSSFLEVMLEVEGKQNLTAFLSKLFKVFHSILKNKVFPANWLNINILSHKTSLKLVRVVARLMEREFIPPFATLNRTPVSGDPTSDPNRVFNSELWSDFFVLLHGLLSSQHLVIEEYPPQKRRAVWKLAGDVRGEGSKLLKRCWEAIGSQSLKAGDDTTTCGGYQIQFIPGIVELVLELCLSHHDEMRTNAVTMLYSIMITEYQANRDLTVVTDEIIDKLDSLLGNSPSSQNDEMSRAFFVGQLQSLFESDPIDEHLQKQVETFMQSTNQFLELLLSIRNLPPGDEFIDDRVIGTLKLMSFIRNIGRSGIYIHYVHKLVNFHASCGNYVEAGLAMRLHSDLHSWDLETVVEAMPELALPKQTAFRRKESGIQICKELQEQYEHVSFDYERLSEVLAHQSSLYQKIVKSERYFSEYFRVAFYGLGFPPSVQNRQFVYRGYEFEKYAEFCDRMNNKHPNAQIIRANVVSSDELQYAEGQYLHITKVQAEPDRNSIIFTNLEVPNAVRQYYENNATNTFSYTRPFSKEEMPNLDPVMMWVEKTFLVCEDAFPTVLQRSEVLEIRFLEISPIENAILITDQKTRELDTLQRRYLALSKTGGTKLNTNPLSMALNGAYLAQNPDQQETVLLLRQAIDNQTAVIDEGLKLHQALCPPEMKTFHSTLYRCRLHDYIQQPLVIRIWN